MPVKRVNEQDPESRRGMIRFFKFVVFVCLVGLLALIGYAYLGDLTPQREEVRIPVELDAD